MVVLVSREEGEGCDSTLVSDAETTTAAGTSNGTDFSMHENTTSVQKEAPDSVPLIVGSPTGNGSVIVGSGETDVAKVVSEKADELRRNVVDLASSAGQEAAAVVSNISHTVRASSARDVVPSHGQWSRSQHPR